MKGRTTIANTAANAIAAALLVMANSTQSVNSPSNVVARPTSRPTGTPPTVSAVRKSERMAGR